MKAFKFEHKTVTIEINGITVDFEAHGEVDPGGKVFIDELYYQKPGASCNPGAHDLLEIQLVRDSIENQILGRK